MAQEAGVLGLCRSHIAGTASPVLLSPRATTVGSTAHWHASMGRVLTLHTASFACKARISHTSVSPTRPKFFVVNEITQVLSSSVQPTVKVLIFRRPFLQLCPHRPVQGQAGNRHSVC